MPPLLTIALAAWGAGAMALLGGTLAFWEASEESPRKEALVHGVVAFGGGVLLAAATLALLPRGMEHLSTPVLLAAFCGGGVLVSLLDAAVTRWAGPRAQFLAMLIDFVPEALTLGAVFSADRRLGLLLTAFIGLQNLPEGFNAYREVVGGGVRPRQALAALAAVSLLGPLAALAGHVALQDHETLTATIMTLAAGGILYLVFQDIAPQARLTHRWTPPLGAVLGFGLGLLGEQLL